MKKNDHQMFQQSHNYLPIAFHFLLELSTVTMYMLFEFLGVCRLLKDSSFFFLCSS